jgi:NADP-dependent 3-hydroxy acid dehydrogenase YdfG
MGSGRVSVGGESLAGRVALVTGASSGIGEATALALSDRGATVALCGRRADRLRELAARIEAGGGRALTIEADLTDEAQARGVVQRTVDELGRLDTLVNNAGVMLLGPVEEAPLAEWDEMVAINVNAVLYCAHAALPHLLAAAEDSPRRVADMVNLSSTAGRAARGGSAAYNLTKFGVGAFSEALRQEVTSRRLRVSLVEPGATETELRTHLRDGIREEQFRRIEDIEILRAADVAEAILYIVTRPWRMSVSEITIRPTEQG